MASLAASFATTAGHSTTSGGASGGASAAYSSSIFIKTPKFSPCKTRRAFSCRSQNGGHDNQKKIHQDFVAAAKLDRRNMLLGLGAGGLYGAASLSADPFAFAAPVSAPDVKGEFIRFYTRFKKSKVWKHSVERFKCLSERSQFSDVLEEDMDFNTKR